MILGFRHKGLELLFEKGDRRKVLSDHAAKIERILARLDEASKVGHMDLPGFRLHALKGDLAGYWSVTVEDLIGDARFRLEGIGVTLDLGEIYDNVVFEHPPEHSP